jgi:type III secretory pathway component EscR
MVQLLPLAALTIMVDLPTNICTKSVIKLNCVYELVTNALGILHIHICYPSQVMGYDTFDSCDMNVPTLCYICDP